jgi:formylglycine-generating enzyme required for sulfatase activity
MFTKVIEIVLLFLVLAGCVTTTVPPIAPASTPFILLVNINAAGDYFIMGDGTTGVNASETITYNYRMAKYETTNAQFSQFIQDGGYNDRKYWSTNGWAQRTAEGWNEPLGWPDPMNNPNHPVGGVSWYEAVAFCNWLSLKEGLAPAYNSSGQASLSSSGYRLPTETEWEYAAAKGGSGQGERIYPYGDIWDINKDVDVANSPNPDKVGSAKVGSRSAEGGDTPQGLSDMGGNVREWCSDNGQDDGNVTSGINRYYFENDSTSQPFIIRGGANHCTREESFRCAAREPVRPFNRGSDYGFRVVRL